MVSNLPSCGCRPRRLFSAGSAITPALPPGACLYRLALLSTLSGLNGFSLSLLECLLESLDIMFRIQDTPHEINSKYSYVSWVVLQ